MSKERSSLALILKLDAHARKFITVHSLDNGGQNITTKTFNILDSGPPQIPGGRNITEKSSRRLRTRQSQRKKIATAGKRKIAPEKQLPDLKRNLQRQRNNRKRRSRDELH